MKNAPTGRQRVHLTSSSPFYKELQRRVADYFETAGKDQGATWQMWLKTASNFVWLGVCYGLYLTLQGPWWVVALLGAGAGLGVAGLGFNVIHDGGHRAFSRTKPWVNRSMASVLDLLGGSSYLWHWKHNVFHHTYPNIEGLDDDIAVAPLARMAPTHPRYRFHRLQSLYMWALYSLLAAKWHFVDDFVVLGTGRVNGHPIPRPRGRALVQLIAGKLLWAMWMVVLPLLLIDWSMALVFVLAAEATAGLVLSVIFQLAHCVEEAEFEALPAEGRTLRADFAAHQLRTTVDFAPTNRVLTWLVGGLNFQAVHHLFPRVCHVHYPALSRIISDMSAEYGIVYRVNGTFRAAIASHYRLLRRMGQPLTSATG